MLWRSFAWTSSSKYPSWRNSPWMRFEFCQRFSTPTSSDSCRFWRPATTCTWYTSTVSRGHSKNSSIARSTYQRSKLSQLPGSYSLLFECFRRTAYCIETSNHQTYFLTAEQWNLLILDFVSVWLPTKWPTRWSGAQSIWRLKCSKGRLTQARPMSGRLGWYFTSVYMDFARIKTDQLANSSN